MAFTFDPAYSLIVVVDDDEGNLFTFRNNFRDMYRIHTFTEGGAALEFIRGQGCDILISDQRMPGMTGLELVREAREIDPLLVALLFSAFTDIGLLTDCINSNDVHRFLEKPLDFERVRFEVARAVDRRRLLLENEQYRRMLQLENRLLREDADRDRHEIIGGDGDLRPVLSKAEKVAAFDSSVLITGETGTGKELLARFIHNRSPRADRPFVPVVCSAFGVGVLESELFGHEKGAFTGADSRRIGRFEAADSGTLFLDEIGDVTLSVQKKLLRVLQERCFERVGGNETIAVDVRLVAATNRNLEAMVREGEFREDLYYRINVVPLHLPPLRRRKTDLELLIDHYFGFFRQRFRSTVSGISDGALERLRRYGWPGNVRELANVFERAMITAPGDLLEPEDLAIALDEDNGSGLTPERVASALEESAGNRSRAAESCGVSRQYFHRKMKEYGIQ